MFPIKANYVFLGIYPNLGKGFNVKVFKWKGLSSHCTYRVQFYESPHPVIQEEPMNRSRIQMTVSKKGRRVIGRLLPGTDLITGIEAMCHKGGVSSGSILSVLGSLAEAQIVYAVPDESGKVGIRYHDPVKIEGPLELLACQGVVGQTDAGELSVHLHGLMSNSAMTVCGGHFLADGNPVLATAEIVIQENSDVRTIREQDDETGFALFKFYPPGSN